MSDPESGCDWAEGGRVGREVCNGMQPCSGADFLLVEREAIRGPLVGPVFVLTGVVGRSRQPPITQFWLGGGRESKYKYGTRLQSGTVLLEISLSSCFWKQVLLLSIGRFVV